MREGSGWSGALALGLMRLQTRRVSDLAVCPGQGVRAADEDPNWGGAPVLAEALRSPTQRQTLPRWSVSAARRLGSCDAVRSPGSGV